MLEFQNIPILFTEGVDTKTDKYLKTANDVLRNATVSGKGTPSKRNGFDKSGLALFASFNGPYPYSVEEIYDVHSGNNQLGVLHSQGCATYNPETNGFSADAFVSTKPVSYISPAIKSISSVPVFESGDYQAVSYAKCSTHSAVFGTNRAAVYDAKGRLVFDNETTGTFKFLVINDEIYVVSVALAGNSLRISKILPDGSSVLLGTLADSNFNINSFFNYYDCCTDGTDIFVVAFATTGVNANLLRISTNGLTTTTATIALLAGTSKIQTPAICADPINQRVIVSYIQDNSPAKRLIAETLDYSLTVLNAGKLIDTLTNVVGSVDIINTSACVGGTAYFASCGVDEVLLAATYNYLTYVAIWSGRFKKLEVTTKPKVLGQSFCLGVRQRSLAGSASASRDHYLLSFARGLSNDWTDSASPLLRDVEDSRLSGQNYPFAPYDLTGYVVNNGGTNLEVFSFNFDRSDFGSALEVSGVGYICGGLSYDGIGVTPIGFHSRPSIDSLTRLDGVIAAGTYNYVLVFSRVNTFGQIERSQPSEAETITVIANSKVQIEFQSNYLDDGVVAVEIYRKLSTETVYRLAGVNTYFPQNIGSVSIEDNVASVAGQPTLYTTGDILENDPPPPFSSLAYHQGRLFGVNPTKISEIWFSKLKEVGVPVEFSAFNTIQLDENQGRVTERVTALASLDNRLIVFKEASIFAIFGQGPDNAGRNGEFSRPEIVSSEVGCVDPRSVCVTSDGVYFKSAKGIYLLTSIKLELIEIGAPVFSFNNEKITSAVVMREKQQIRFGTKAGNMLVYDYSYRQWSTFTNLQSVGAVQLGDNFYVAASNGIQTENEVFSDNGTFVQQDLTTGWLKLSGIDNFARVQRIKLLGAYRNDHIMKVRVSYDYEEYVWDEYILTPASGYNITVKPAIADYQNGTNSGVFEWELHLRKQKCKAMKVQIIDEQGATIGASFDLTGMTLRVGIKKGLSKITSNKAQ